MIHTHKLDCGLVVLVEPIASVASCSVHWVVPAGNAYDEPNRVGISTVLAEMLIRGAGGRDSRRLSDDMDRIGLERDCGVSGPHGWLVGTVLGKHLESALGLFTDVIRDPMLPAESLPACQSLAVQSIESLEDEPQQEAMLHVRRRHHPPPFNRSGYGQLEVVESATADELKQAWQAGFVPQGSILGLAGDVDPEVVIHRLDSLLTGWEGSREEPTPLGERQGGRGHLQRDSSQVHLGMGWAGPAAREADSLLERLGTRILGGSSSGRLFTEVRQRRSLCYSVSASYRAHRDEGVLSLYAGTTPDRAAETLAVCEAEIERMSKGVDAEEFDRAKVGLQGSMVFSGERTQARASALVADQYAIGHPRSMEDRLAEIEGLDRDQLNAYLAGKPAPELTVVAVGQEPPGEGFEAEPQLCHSARIP